MRETAYRVAANYTVLPGAPRTAWGQLWELRFRSAPAKALTLGGQRQCGAEASASGTLGLPGTAGGREL